MLLLQLLANGIITSCVYALLALGFSLIYSTTSIFHFAYAANYTAAAYILYMFLIGLGWNIFLSLVLALIFSALLGMAMEKWMYYPLYKKNAPGAVSIISSLGANIVLVNLIAMIWGNETKILRPGIEKTYHIGSIILTRVQVYEFFIFLILFTTLILFLKKNKFGKIIRALADNPTLVTVVGIDIKKMRLIVFGIGSFLAGVASILVALDVGVDPHVGFNAVLAGAVATIIGGIGVFEGAVLGGFILGITQNLVIWKTSARWEQAITFVILIVFLLIRPQGILGRKTRLEEA